VKTEPPVITVYVITYNHARFVRQTLDSILMQEVRVPYEVLILDDASTDGTQDILREYQRRNPDRIRLYLRRHNSGSWPSKNTFFLYERGHGRYIAWLEGDDYWTDPHKLQMQYDYLEQHPEVSACVTKFSAVDGDGHPVPCHKGDFQPDGIFTLEHFRRHAYVGQTLTIFARAYLEKGRAWRRILYQADHIMDDITIYMLLLCEGNIAQLPAVTAAYRWQHAAGGANWNSKILSDPFQRCRFVRFWFRLDRYLRQRTGRGVRPQILVRDFWSLDDGMTLRARWQLAKELIPRWRGWLIFLVYLLAPGEEMCIESRHPHRTGLPQDLWQRPLILFGAGRLCEIFLKRYGWHENIRFLVDNDEALWGKTRYGCYVKAPQELWIWRKKANILILNAAHEQEIYEQVEKIGAEHIYCWHSAMHGSWRNRLARYVLEKFLKV